MPRSDRRKKVIDAYRWKDAAVYVVCVLVLVLMVVLLRDFP